MKRTSCLNCNVPFEPNRTDQMFCSDRCGSAYWKLHGTTHTHKDLPHFNCKDCEQCSNQFWYNDYAERNGKRIPKFCSTRCRVRHFRGTADKFREHAEKAHKEEQREAPYARPFKTGDFRDTLHVPVRWTREAAFMWLGVNRNADKGACHKAMRSLNQKYHPDLNNGIEWPHLKTINAAYDFLKRKVFD